VVICHQLTSEPKPRLWNAPRVEVPDEFNPEEPLQNRIIRLWPTPSGSQSKGVPLISAAEASPAGQSTTATAEREAARLLYVGLTRARDLLILPRADGKQPWLPEGVQLAEYASSFEELDEILGRKPERTLREFSSEPVTTEKDVEASVEAFRREKTTPREFIPANLVPSACPAIPTATVAEVIDYAPAVDLSDANLNPEALGNAVRRLIAHSFSTGVDELSEDCVHRVSEAYGLSIEAAPILNAIAQLRSQLEKRFRPTGYRVEAPFSADLESGQKISGFMDLVLETEAGTVVIDHKSYRGEDWENYVLNYSGQLNAYATALEQLARRPDSLWINLWSVGKLLRIEV